MNWSVHQDSLSAQEAIDIQRKMTVDCKSSLMESFVASDEFVDVIFVGVPVKALKVVLELTDKAPNELRKRGTKNLIAYYIVAPVRGNWVSCVLSHWNNDIIGKDGLPALLSKVMSLETKNK